MSKAAPSGRALLALVLLSVIWGYSWVVTKVGLRYCGPFQFVALRTLLGVVCLLAVLLWKRTPLKPQRVLQTAALGFLQTSGFLLLSSWALVEGGAGKTAVLVFTMPFWVLLLAWPLLGERIRGSQWLPVALAFGGLVLVLEPWGLRTTLLSKLLAVSAGVSWAGSAILVKKMEVKGPVDLLSLTFWQMFWGLLPVAAVALLVPEGPIVWSPMFVATLLFNGVLTTALGWHLWLFILHALPAGTASMSALAIPVIALLTSSLQLGEIPSGAELVGMLLIALALGLISIRSVRQHRAVTPTISQG